MSFADHFSGVSSAYAEFRPEYPDELFAFLASMASSSVRAVDVGAGTGQASGALRRHFEQVIACEPSIAQLASAFLDRRVCASAESLPLMKGSADLITVAQALHWFDLERFYAEVRRVARAEAIVAVWSYAVLRLDASLQPLFDEFYWETLRGYWPAERRHVENGYAELGFPFERVDAPPFALSYDWSLDHLLGYISTWSAVAKLRASEGDARLREFAERFGRAWGETPTRRIEWPLTLRVGRVEGVIPKERLHRD